MFLTLLSHITLFMGTWPLQSQRVEVWTGDCPQGIMFGILCLLVETAWLSPVFHVSLPIRFCWPASTATGLKGGHPHESWVQVCPRPGFQTRSPGKPSMFCLKSHTVSFIWPQDIPHTRFSLILGLSARLSNLLFISITSQGFYQLPWRPILCLHSQRLWSLSVLGCTF